MPQSTIEILGLIGKTAMAGLLGLLWLDVRKVRGMKGTILESIRGEFLTKEDHTVQCKFQALVQENLQIKTTNEIKEYISDTQKDILEDVRIKRQTQTEDLKKYMDTTQEIILKAVQQNGKAHTKII